MIHRDITPANIFVTAAGPAKVLDFGLAKLTSRATTASALGNFPTISDVPLTDRGVVVGTVAYMSPEQARGEDLDARTDLFSFGAVLYEMATGSPAFSGATPAVIYNAIMNLPSPSASRLNPGIPQILDQIIQKALEKERDQEYLSDGLTQEMITLMGRLHPQGLGVIARTSVMRYKKAEASIDQIGRDLGVGYVLEGSVRREGSRVRVAADLIQVRDQVQLWGDVFEREMAGILALQNDVAREVAKALALKLLPSEQARFVQARPVNPEAHEAYVRGSFHLWKLTRGDLDIAEKYFDLALEKDPAYAPAYAGRAWVWGGAASAVTRRPRRRGRRPRPRRCGPSSWTKISPVPTRFWLGSGHGPIGIGRAPGDPGGGPSSSIPISPARRRCTPIS